MRLLTILLVAASIFGMLQISGHYHIVQVEEDSPGYQTFASELLSGHFFERKAPTEISSMRAVRTPGYPLLLAFADTFIGGEVGRVLILHLFLAIAALVAIPIMLNKNIWAPISAWLLLLALLDFRNFFPKILTEWSSLIAICFLIAACVVVGNNRSNRSYLALGVITSICILIRPALSVIIPLVLLYSFLASNWKKSFAITCIGLSPIFFWCLINLATINVFGLSAFNGYNLFGVGSVVGYTEAKPEDPQDLKDFITYVNGAKSPPPGKESVEEYLDFPGMRSSTYNANIYQIAVKFPQSPSLGPVRMNELMKIYGTRAITSHLGNYIDYIIGGLFFTLGREWIVILAAAIGWIGLYNVKSRPLAYATLFCLAFHVLHLFLCLSIQAIGLRYFQLTLVPLYWISSLTAIALIQSRKKLGFE